MTRRNDCAYRSALAILLAGAGLGTAWAAGRECCCAHCGYGQACRKVCRLVCEEKKVEVVCWGVKCEDFCLPTPSAPGCKHCKNVCAECDQPCDPDAPHVEPKRFVWRDWRPGCAKIHTKKKLMKKVETVIVPSHKWVVEEVCSDCADRCLASVEYREMSCGASLPPLPGDDRTADAVRPLREDCRTALANPAAQSLTR